MNFRWDGCAGEDYGKIILGIDLPFEEYEMALMALEEVNEVRRKKEKAQGQHWSQWELELRLHGFKRPVTTGVTKHGHTNAIGVHVYHRHVPDETGFWAAVRKVIMAAVQDAVAVFKTRPGVVERTYWRDGASASMLQPAIGGMFDTPPAKRQQVETRPALLPPLLNHVPWGLASAPALSPPQTRDPLAPPF